MAKTRGVRYFPIALFASVMGVSGVSIALRQLENLFQWQSSFLSTLFLIIATLLFILNGSIFIYRLIRFPKDIRTDFNHPVKMNFFGAISISLLLLSVLYFDINASISFVSWVVAALFQLGLTLLVLSKLIWGTTFKIQQFNPAWFIPIVGNIVVPLSGVLHVSKDINLIFYGVGILFSIIYFVLFIYRAFFYDSMPIPLTPTYFILLAPPAVGFVSYIQITEQVDTFAYIMYGVAFYLGLLLLVQLKRFLSTPFFISWWAFLFPSAAMTIATAHMYIETGKIYYEWIFVVQVIGLLFLSIYLLAKTIQLAINRKLCVKEG